MSDERKLHWKRRLDEAQERNEPLKVTAEEFNELKRDAPDDRPDFEKVLTPMPFWGWPVVVEEAR